MTNLSKVENSQLKKESNMNLQEKITNYFDIQIAKLGCPYFDSNKYSRSNQIKLERLIKKKRDYLEILEYKTNSKKAENIRKLFN